MQSKEAERFDQAASALGKAVQSLLCAVGEREKAETCEIRLRVGSPAILSLPSGAHIAGTSPITRELMDDAVLNLCGYSIYTHQHELAAGYISIPGGHRAGVSGRAAVSGGTICAVCDVTTICLRIARDYAGCADRLLDGLFDGGVCSAVIAGSPGSGKTTILRDIACSLADGKTGRRLNVAVVDERNEIALTEVSGDISRVCRRCDVLSGYPKAEGISQAIRALAPDVIICDEIGSGADMSAIQAGINAGVKMICSVHAGTAEELALRPVTHRLLETGAFHRFALLSGRDRPGSIQRIMNREEIYELACRCSGRDMRGAGGAGVDRPAAQTNGAARADGALSGYGDQQRKLQPHSA